MHNEDYGDYKRIMVNKFTTKELIKYLRDVIEEQRIEGYSIYDEELKSEEIVKRLLELEKIQSTLKRFKSIITPVVTPTVSINTELLTEQSYIEDVIKNDLDLVCAVAKRRKDSGMDRS